MAGFVQASPTNLVSMKKMHEKTHEKLGSTFGLPNRINFSSQVRSTYSSLDMQLPVLPS